MPSALCQPRQGLLLPESLLPPFASHRSSEGGVPVVTMGKGQGRIRTQLCGVASCGTVSHVTTLQLAPWAGPGFYHHCPALSCAPTPRQVSRSANAAPGDAAVDKQWEFLAPLRAMLYDFLPWDKVQPHTSQAERSPPELPVQAKVRPPPWCPAGVILPGS